MRIFPQQPVPLRKTPDNIPRMGQPYSFAGYNDWIVNEGHPQESAAALGCAYGPDTGRLVVYRMDEARRLLYWADRPIVPASHRNAFGQPTALLKYIPLPNFKQAIIVPTGIRNRTRGLGTFAKGNIGLEAILSYFVPACEKGFKSSIESLMGCPCKVVPSLQGAGFARHLVFDVTITGAGAGFKVKMRHDRQVDYYEVVALELAERTKAQITSHMAASEKGACADVQSMLRFWDV